MSAKIYTIPPERPFLEALAEGLLARYFNAREPLSFARVTVLLPTRRAVRTLAESLLVAAELRELPAALVLPHIRPIGDVDEEALGLGEADVGLDLAPALPPLRARLLLARLVQARHAGADRAGKFNAAQAALLARALEDLLARVETFGSDLTRLATLVPDALSGHWQETLEFLRILTESWPAILAEQGAIGMAARRNALQSALATRWRNTPPEGPVIAAGSTGTLPATAALLSVVANLPEGAVVLPGLDLTLDEETWALVDESHPQGAMKALLARLDVAREAVAIWSAGVPRGNAARVRVLAEALRPAEATDGWANAAPRLKDTVRAPLALGVIEAPHPALEAEAIALILRRVLETPDETAALVTPDRALARRVVAALERYAISVDDSAGTPLSLTLHGVFLRLVAQAAMEALAPVPLLALLKHPLAACGMSAERARGEVRALELAVLRGPAPAPGLDGLRRAVEAGKEELRASAISFVEQLEPIFKPLLDAVAKGETRLDVLLRLHLSTAEALAADGEKPGAARLWAGGAGEAAAEFFAELAVETESFPYCPPTEYPALLDALMAERVVRPAFGRHPRIFIWGPLEARLQRADTVVLGGLNEGTWPAEAEADPWLSRPMARVLGLPSPEQRVGLSAHDFVHCASQARRVYLTRSEKVNGTPTVPSRWLVRLRTLLSGLGRADLLRPEEPWLGWVAARDKPAAIEPCDAPAPRPPVAARPRRLSVTQIERYLRDPYAIYARYVLGLKPLYPVDEKPDARHRGTLLHEIFQRVGEGGFDANAADALDRLIAIGRAVFDHGAVPPAVEALWWPRFIAAAQAFIIDEWEWSRSGARILAAERNGHISFAAPAGEFTLTARADRIDRLADGTLAIFDYKTGQAPSEPQVKSGLAPQLPLEAAIAERGGFENIEAAPISALAVICLRARGSERRSFDDPAALARDSYSKLENLIRRYDDAEMPYLARLRPMFAQRPDGDYDHLSRLKEWSAEGAESGGEGS